MELKFAMLADYASETRENKLNVMGEFDSIWAQQTPAIWPQMFLVARLEASVSEGTRHKIQVGLFNEDGQPVIPLTPELDVNFISKGPGRPFRGQFIVSLNGVTFPAYGDYEFHILVDGRRLATVPIYILRPPTAKK